MYLQNLVDSDWCEAGSLSQDDNSNQRHRVSDLNITEFGDRKKTAVIAETNIPKYQGNWIREILNVYEEQLSILNDCLLHCKADEGIPEIGDSSKEATRFLLNRVVILIRQLQNLIQKFNPVTEGRSEEEPVESLDEKFKRKVVEVVSLNIGEPSFSVEELAKEMCVSRSQLFRRFKGITGLSPNKYISEVRLQCAAGMILGKRDTLTQIAYSVGFSEQSYFAKCFRRKFGVAPRDYAAMTSAINASPLKINTDEPKEFH